MIKFLSNWAKNIGFSIIIISILEMILPNNKSKKYIKMVMGTYIIFCIISPFIKNKIDLNNIDIEEYAETSTTEVNQESMDKRIEQLYIEELEKDITTKVEEKGYIVKSCNVDATITQNVKDTKINKITLKVEANENKKEESETAEGKLVTEVQKIKEIDTAISKENTKENKQKSKLTRRANSRVKKVFKRRIRGE